jgi:hypothetical protein
MKPGPGAGRSTSVKTEDRSLIRRTQENTEFAVGRLRFHSPFDGFRRHRWGVDANKGDRLFSRYCAADATCPVR